MAFQLNFPSTGSALVIGGSGGAGSEICRALAKAGSSVALTYHSSEARARSVCDAIEALGQKALSLKLDCRDFDAVKNALDLVATEFDGIHTVVCASGPMVRFRTIFDLEIEKWQSNIDSEINGFFNLAKASIPHLRKSSGSLVALSTMCYHRILTHDAISASPKAAIETLVRQLAYEEGGNGIRANVVALGAINAGMGAVDSDSSIVEDMGPEAVAGVFEKIRLGRMGSAEEVANAVVFLASGQASYITGQTLVVDGGWTL